MGGRFGQGSCGRAPLCKSLVKALLRNTASVTPGALVLTCVLASSPDAQHVRKYREPESKGSCTAVQKSVCATVQAWGWWGEGTGSRAWDKGAPRPRMCFTSSYMTVLRQALCAGPGKVPELNTDRVICKVTKKNKNQKTDVAESKAFKLESFLEEGKVFHIMSKMRLNSTHGRMKRSPQFKWRGGCWLQTFQAVSALLWQVTP